MESPDSGEYEDVQKLVWQGLSHSESLSRYYGDTAGKLTRWSQGIAGCGCVLGVVSALLVAREQWLWLAIALIVVTAIANAIAAIQAGQGRVTRAVYCQKEFDDLHVDWVALWNQMPSMSNSAILSSWTKLSRQANNITAMSPLNATDKRLYKKSENESEEFLSLAFKEQDDR